MSYLIKDPLIELLAIKLYEHDSFSYVEGGTTWPLERTCWSVLPEEDREIYRRIARGEEEYLSRADGIGD